MAFLDSIYGRLKEVYSFLNSLIPNFLGRTIVAIIILLVGFIIGKLLGKLLKRVLMEVELNQIIYKATGIKANIEVILSNLLSYLIYFLTVVMALNQMGLTTIILYMIAGAVIIFLIISWLLAIKDFLPNVFAGLFINRNSFIKIGDRIRFNNIEGCIVSISLLETRMQNKDGDIISIPNSKLTKEEFVKISEKTRKTSKETTRKTSRTRKLKKTDRAGN